MNSVTRALALVSVVAVPVFTGGCSPSDDPSTSDSQSQEGDALSATARAYVTLRRDTRKCAAPACGGWFAKDINKKNPTERYVSGLDFSAAGLDDDAIDDAESAADGEVVVRAKLGAADSHGIRKLLVSEAYRGMPGYSPAAGDFYYFVAPRDPQIKCVTAPCNNLSAKKINTTSTTNYTRDDIELGAFIDNAWLTERAESEGAIVVGNLHAGDKFPGGNEQVLTASQVMPKLPEGLRACSKIAKPSCPSGQVRAYYRSTDRCVLPGDCVKQGACPNFFPSCGDDYTMTTFKGGASGCSQFICDPTWSVESD